MRIILLQSQIMTETESSQQQFSEQNSLLRPTEQSTFPSHISSENGPKKNRFFIRKCCGFDQVYNFNWEDNVADRKERCVNYSITSSSPFKKNIFLHSPSEYVLENVEVSTGFPKDCELDMKLDPGIKMADLFYPLSSGELLVPHRFWQIKPEGHCIEDFIENHNFYKLRRVAFICTSHITEFPTTAINNIGKLQFNFIGSILPAELSSIVGRTVIRKCCDRNEVYSLADGSCVENQGFATDFFDKLESERRDEIFFRIGFLNCADQKFIFNKFQLDSNGSLEIINARNFLSRNLISVDHYCIEDTVFFNSVGLPETTSNQVFFCSSDQHNTDQQVPEPGYSIDSGTPYEISYNDSIKTNTPKCCPLGSVMDEHDTCQPLNSPDADSIISQELVNYLLINATFNIATNVVPNNLSNSCKLNRAEIWSDTKFELDVRNELSVSYHFHTKNYWDFKMKLKPFCVDLALDRSEKGVFYQALTYYCQGLTHSHTVSIHFPILLGISAACLIITSIIYFFVPASGSAKLAKSGLGGKSGTGKTATMASLLTGRILLCHISTLSITFICLAIVQRGHFTPTETSCVTIGYLIYGLSIASFSWLTVYCFDYYRIFRGSFKVSNNMLFIPYSIFGWGVPILATIATAISQFRSTDIGISGTFNPNMGLLNCWFPEGGTSVLIFFYAPVGTLLLLDIMCFVSLILNPNLMQCCKKKQEMTIRSNRKASKGQDFNIALKLFLINGIPWVFEVAAILPVYLSDTPTSLRKSIGFYVIEIGTLLNSLRGVIIFIIFIVLQRDVRHFLMLNLKRMFKKDSSASLTFLDSRKNTDCIGDPSVSTQELSRTQQSTSLIWSNN